VRHSAPPTPTREFKTHTHKTPHPINPPRTPISKTKQQKLRVSFSPRSPPVSSPNPSWRRPDASTPRGWTPRGRAWARIPPDRARRPRWDGPCISFLILASRPRDDLLTTSWFLRVQELEGAGYSSAVGAAEGTASRQAEDGLGGGLLHFLIFFFCALVLIRAFNEGWTGTSGVCLSQSLRFLIPKW
jgi:hypothetical protein